MFKQTFKGWAILTEWTDGTERIMVYDNRSTKEAFNDAEEMLKTNQKAHPDKEFRLINVKIDITEVEPSSQREGE